MKTQMISKLALGGCIGLFALVLVLFVFLEEDTSVDIMCYAMYAYIGAMLILMLVNFGLAIGKYRDGGLMRVLIAAGASFALLIALYFITGDASNAFIITSFYVLLPLAAIAALICATGILSKSATKKLN